MRDRYNQAPRLTQDTNGKVTSSQLDIPNESQEVSPFPAGDHKALMDRRVLIGFSLSVKAVTLIFISGRCSASSSAKQEKSGSICNLVNN